MTPDQIDKLFAFKSRGYEVMEGARGGPFDAVAISTVEPGGHNHAGNPPTNIDGFIKLIKIVSPGADPEKVKRFKEQTAEFYQNKVFHVSVEFI